ncbi:MAG: RluA family pseudouridine synthase [Myxococcota bacterium]|jgi:23S rRNA pseudouridine1911/1915/1917 synthase|nr:RluA family pseudouridine synthase [Myxococcota bacterium]
MRLSKHLRDLGLTSAQVKKALASGKVLLCGIPTSDGGRDVEPSQVEHRPDATRLVPGRDLFMLHRDADLVVVCKPAGLLSVAAGKEGGHLNVVGLVNRLTGAGLAVHRLDEQTSGLMLVARNAEAQEALKAQLEVHSVERRYLAIAQGRPRSDHWTVESHLVRDRGDGLRGSVQGAPPEDARRAVTHFERLGPVGPRATMIGARLETGRTHQVRIHLAENRLPILGDPLYAPTGIARAAGRLALHAAVLGFEHPRTGQELRFEAPLADDLERLRRRLCHEPEPVRGRRPKGARKRTGKKRR